MGKFRRNWLIEGTENAKSNQKKYTKIIISGFLETNKNLMAKAKGHYSLSKIKKNNIFTFSFIKI